MVLGRRAGQGGRPRAKAGGGTAHTCMPVRLLTVRRALTAERPRRINVHKRYTWTCKSTGRPTWQRPPRWPPHHHTPPLASPPVPTAHTGCCLPPSPAHLEGADAAMLQLNVAHADVAGRKGVGDDNGAGDLRGGAHGGAVQLGVGEAGAGAGAYGGQAGGGWGGGGTQASVAGARDPPRIVSAQPAQAAQLSAVHARSWAAIIAHGIFRAIEGCLQHAAVAGAGPAPYRPHQLAGRWRIPATSPAAGRKEGGRSAFSATVSSRRVCRQQKSR